MLIIEKRGCVWPGDGWIICSASHRLAAAGKGGSGTDKYMDELDPVGWSIPMARGIVHPSQKVSALQWRRPVLWADYTSRSGVDYLLLLGYIPNDGESSSYKAAHFCAVG